MDEDLNARFNHGDTNLYKSDKKRRESFNRNNQRNRDILSVGKATGKIITAGNEKINEAIRSQEEQQIDAVNRTEEAMIELLDFKYKKTT